MVGKKIRLYILLLVAGSCLSACNRETKNESVNVPEIIGELILERELERSYVNGEDPFGVGPAMSRMLAAYDANKNNMSEAQKVDFFWIMFWHQDLDGGEMDLFLRTVNKEAKKQFLIRLKNYIEVESRLERSHSRLEYAKKTILHLDAIRN